MNLPTILTLLRIGLIPFLVLFFYLPIPGNRIICAVLFVLAGFTDWLDGYLARKNNQMSLLGAFLDPVADKLIVVMVLILIVGEHGNVYVTLPTVVIVGREIAVSALREWMAELGKRGQVAVSNIGKYKTTIQMVSITSLLAYKAGKWMILDTVGIVTLYIAAVLTLWSMGMYLRAAWPVLVQSQHMKRNVP